MLTTGIGGDGGGGGVGLVGWYTQKNGTISRPRFSRGMGGAWNGRGFHKEKQINTDWF